MNTIFPRNLAAARFNFKSLHPAARFRGWRLVYSPASRLLSISIVRIARVRLHSAYFESDDPFSCGEISRTAFIGTNLLIGVARFRGNTVRVLDAPGCYESAVQAERKSALHVYKAQDWSEL